jgi:hypothetical protein
MRLMYPLRTWLVRDLLEGRRVLVFIAERTTLATLPLASLLPLSLLRFATRLDAGRCLFDRFSVGILVKSAPSEG